MARTTRTNLIIGTIAALGTIAVGIGAVAVAVGSTFASADVAVAAWEDTNGTVPDRDVNDAVAADGTAEPTAQRGIGADAGAGASGDDAPTSPSSPASDPPATGSAPAAAAPTVDGSGVRTSPTLPRTAPIIGENDGPTAQVVSIACDASIVLVFGLASPDGVRKVTASYDDWTGRHTVNLTDVGGSKYRFKVADTKGSGFRNLTVSAKDSLGNLGTTFIGNVCTGGPGSLTDL